MESWLNTLNVLDSPTEVSPTTGPNDLYRSADSLSHPISSQDLFDQLQQWTNVDFNFNEPQQPATSVPSTNLESTSAHPYSGMFDSAQNRLGSIKGKSYEKGFSAPATSTFIDPNAVFAPQVDPVLFGNDLSLPTTSSFQYPALYPNFPAFEQQPIPAEPAPAPINPELTSSKATKSKAPKKGKKTTPAAVEKEKSAASTPVATTSPEGEEGQVPEVDDKRRRNTLASGSSLHCDWRVVSYQRRLGEQHVSE